MSLWHRIKVHWIQGTLGWIWYKYFELSKPELGFILVRAARFYRKMDVVLIPRGTLQRRELHLQDVTDDEWDKIIKSPGAAELSQTYLDIIEARNVQSK